MEFKIAIPTHRRSDLIGDMTLKLFKDFNKEDIYLFISDEEDYENYKQFYSDYNLILTLTDNVRDKFNFIQNYFKEGLLIFVLEDDIKEIKDIVNSNIADTFNFIIRYVKKSKCKSFGVYPSSNEFFMSRTIEYGLTYLVANMFGFISQRDQINKDNNCFLKTKNDYERSVLYFKNTGKSIRFNFISCLTNNYTTKGGMQELKERELLEEEACFYLIKRYPKIFSYNDNRSSKYRELKMNKKVKKIKI